MSGDLLKGLTKMGQEWLKLRKARRQQDQRYRATCSKTGHVPAPGGVECVLCGRRIVFGESVSSQVPGFEYLACLIRTCEGPPSCWGCKCCAGHCACK